MYLNRTKSFEKMNLKRLLRNAGIGLFLAAIIYFIVSGDWVALVIGLFFGVIFFLAGSNYSEKSIAADLRNLFKKKEPQELREDLKVLKEQLKPEEKEIEADRKENRDYSKMTEEQILTEIKALSEERAP